MEPARKFKIIVNSKECGTCSGATPSAVAKKVVKKLCGTSSKVVKFSLKECKRGCERVCGPYQGRMEKLDKPYKRAGKKITHRVVCGKVKKMRGGRDLVAEDFEKREDDGDFKFDQIGLRPHIFFGKIKVNGKTYYQYVIFNVEHFGGKDKKCKFQKLNINGLQINVVDITGKDIIGRGGNGNRNRNNTTDYENNTTDYENNNTDYENNKNNLLEILRNLLYCKKLTDYKTIRKTIYDLLKDKVFSNRISRDMSLFEKLNIPNHFFEMDYLPVVITAEEECVPDGFYNLIPEKIDDFLSIDPKYPVHKPTEWIAETNASKRPNFFKRKVYYTVYEENKYIYFSKKKESEYYNIAVVCNENNTAYIGIYNKRTGIVKFYPINKNIFSRFTYPSDFIDLVYLYYPYVHNRYCKNKNNFLIKILEFYSEYISSTIKTKKEDINLNEKIDYLKKKQKNKEQQEQQERKELQHQEWQERQHQEWQEQQQQEQYRRQICGFT